MSNPFPTGVENHPGRDQRFQQTLLGGRAPGSTVKRRGIPGYAYQWNMAVQHQFRTTSRWRSPTPAWTAIISPIDRSTTSWEGAYRSGCQRFVGLQPDRQRDHSPGAGWLHGEPARYLLRRVSAAAGRRIRSSGDPRRPVATGPSSALAAPAVPALSAVEPSRLFRQEPVSRAATPGGQALRGRRAGERQLHVLAEHDECGNGDRLARELCRTRAAGYQTNDLEREWSLSSFDAGTAW